MNILEQALNKIKSSKPQKNFFITLILGMIGIIGKRTYRNLARHTEMHEQTFSRQMAKSFDFMGLNTELIKTAKEENAVFIAAQDATFISKSGKKTHGVDFFWNGSAGKAEKGLELDTIAIIKISKDGKEGFTLSTEQTPANPIPKKDRKNTSGSMLTRIDHYLKHTAKVVATLLKLGIKYIAVDAFFAKEKFINGVVDLGLHVISKLRIDSRLRRPYEGPQKPRGRKRKFDTGKIDIKKDFINSVAVETTDEQGEKIQLYSCIAHSVALNRKIKIVLVKKLIGSDKYGTALLFSTDLELDTLKIYQYYVARFQIEFIFRDAKGFTGLEDCQSRDSRRLNYHFNASLTALNVIRLQDAELQKQQQVKHAFSATNWARKYLVDIMLNRFIATFGLEQTFIKSHPNYEEMRNFASISH